MTPITLFLSFLIFIIIIILATYIYSSLAWMIIARKLKYSKPWLAWIPFANIAMILQLGEFPWGWVFLFLIPILGWITLISFMIFKLAEFPTGGLIIFGLCSFLALFAGGILMIIATWKIFEKRKYPGWFSLSMIIPYLGKIFYLIIIGFVAWADRKKRLNF